MYATQAAGREQLVSRILVVDDNRDAPHSLCILLQLLGADVIALHDGASALAALDGFRPDVILLDVGMLGMSGHEPARRIRARADDSRFTLIAITVGPKKKAANARARPASTVTSSSPLTWRSWLLK